MNGTSTLIVLRGLEGNATVELSAMQESLLPLFPLLERAWWILWCATIAYMTINYVVVPLVARIQSRAR